MGSGESKDATSNSVAPTAGNLMITKEVSERWYAMAMKNVEQQQQGQALSSHMVQFTPDDPNGDIHVQPNAMLDREQGEPVASKHAIEVANQGDQELESKLASLAKQNEAGLISAALLLKKPTLELVEESSSNKLELRTEDMKLDQVRRSIGAEKPSDQLQEKANLLAEMSLEGPSMLQDNRDRGGTVSSISKEDNKDRLLDGSQVDTSPSLDSTEATLESSYQLPSYEENILNRAEKGISEKEVLLVEDLPKGESLKSKQVRVPRAYLPVVIDEEDDGTATIQTISSWRLKEQFEKELIRNNAQWITEMDRLTKKLEENTERHSKELERGIKELEAKYPELTKAEPTCNKFAARIGQCYDKNQTEKLRCFDLVHEFAQCTNSSVNAQFNRNDES